MVDEIQTLGELSQTAYVAGEQPKQAVGAYALIRTPQNRKGRPLRREDAQGGETLVVTNCGEGKKENY